MTKDQYAVEVEHLLPMLTRTARRLVGHDEASDVVHNAVINVWRARGAGIVDVRSLLIAAVKNAAQDYIDSVRRQRSTGGYLEREEPRPTALTEDDLINRVAVQRALAAMPEDIARAVVAVYVEGAEWREVAEELGVEHTGLFRRAQKWLAATRKGASPSGPARGDA